MMCANARRVPGWSFGGIISMEMAYQLATATPQSDDAPRFRVLGIIMVDTVLSRELTGHLPRSTTTPLPPAPRREDDVPVTKTAEELRVMSLKEKVDINMKHAGMMTRAWDLPRWGDSNDGPRVPRTIMLRARDHVGAEAGRGVPAPIDYARDSFRMLGWEKYAEEVGEFIENVVDLDGNHYSIFEFDKVCFPSYLARSFRVCINMFHVLPFPTKNPLDDAIYVKLLTCLHHRSTRFR